ncbi:MAG: low molecular weight protein arginine phosphatase [Candidatus Omnitrophica bacterium]|nr:low molecular weight protein arginine phosphatase [Candidatus Omnitrophota bacterium]
MKNIKKILIVCTGNSCRSIMAEGYLAKRLKEIGAKDMVVHSVGTHAVPGFKPTDEAIEVMKEHGVDVSGYMSSPLNKIHIDTADIILVMEPYHKEKILNLAPDVEKKIKYLREFSSKKSIEKRRIRDPIGQPIEFYKEVFNVIEDSIEGFLKWLKE